MVIEPPGKFFGCGVFEIDDRILIAVKHGHVEKISRSMEKAFVVDLSFRMDAIFVKTSKGRRRRDAVETMTVIKKTKFHFIGQKSGRF
jgi:hypothetical protein